jgi:transposase-like protein
MGILHGVGVCVLHGLDLFSGIGGISLALSPWVRTVAYCENDSYAQAVLLSRIADGHLPAAPIWDDVRTLGADNLAVMLSFSTEEEDMAGRLKKLTQEQVAQAVDGYAFGMSLADLAHIYGVSRQSLWDLLRRRIELRSNLRFGSQNHFYRGGNRADERAHNIVEKAVLAGRLVNPGLCSACGVSGMFADGRTAIQAHHDDYNKALNVRWLCQKCHHEWHRHNQPVPLRKGGDEGSTAIDIIYGGFP